MAHDAEIELLTRFAADLRRVIGLTNSKTPTPEEKSERAELVESLHRRTAAMRRAVERSGVNFLIDYRSVYGIGAGVPVDVLEKWHEQYVGHSTLKVLTVSGALRKVELLCGSRGVITANLSFDKDEVARDRASLVRSGACLRVNELLLSITARSDLVETRITSRSELVEGRVRDRAGAARLVDRSIRPCSAQALR
jgi:hypothetical protein